MQYAYDANGVRTSKNYQRHVIGASYIDYYTVDGTKILSEKRIGGTNNTTQRTIYYVYDANGAVIGMEYNGTKYWYDKNLQGDVVGIRNASGTLVAQYVYDAWGNHRQITDGSGNDVSDNPAHIANINPFRYRGYYYDTETGWYYLNTRYYDPNVGRFLSPDTILGANGGLLGYNLYAYCNNNPVMFSDPNGEFFFTAIIVGAIVGATIGGVVGGVITYNSSKESGQTGTELAISTLVGVGKGALIGATGGALVGGTVAVAATYGAGSVAGTAMITGTLNIAARTVEVTALQTKKSYSEEKSGWEIAKDNLNAVFNNSEQILFPAVTKGSSTGASYLYNDVSKHRVVPLEVDEYLGASKKKILPIATTSYSWAHAAFSIFHNDPLARAIERGYVLE